MKNNSLKIKKLCFSGMFLAIALVLPLLTGQIQQIGNMLCPMHLPVILCGYICGWPWGLAVGFVAPLLRSAIFHMPPMIPSAAAMAFELAVYGFTAGFLYKRLPKKLPAIYLTLFVSMISGRLVWGAVRFLIAGIQSTEFGFAAFWAGAVTTAIPGIIVQIILIPLLVLALERTGLMLDQPKRLNLKRPEAE